MVSWRMLDMQAARRAASWARCRAGSRTEINNAMMATTTSSSTNVKALRLDMQRLVSRMRDMTRRFYQRFAADATARRAGGQIRTRMNADERGFIFLIGVYPRSSTCVDMRWARADQ